MPLSLDPLECVEREVVACKRCPQLIEYCTLVARTKKKAFRDWDYWGKPVPPFGDQRARLLVLGLAPAAHGANRTGRMFTGDRSGDFLFRALHAAGFASQPASRSRGDGLELRDSYISAVIRCAPPGNRPAPEQILNCREYLERELDMLTRLEVVVALGRVAFDQYLTILRNRGIIGSKSGFVFVHGREHTTAPGQPLLISSYHPSQQNTSTKRLTDAMLKDVFLRARRALRKLP